MGDQIVDLVELEPGLVERLAQQRRRGLDRDLVDRPGIGVHDSPGTDLRRKRQTQAAVLGQRREPGHLDAGSALGRPLEDRRGAGVAERQRGELLAHHRADLTRGVDTQMRDVLAADDHAAPDPALPDQVVEDEHPGHHPRAGVREVEAHRAPGAERLLERHAHRRLELHPQTADVTADARHDQHVEVLRSTVRVRQGVARRTERERVGILALANDMALADAGQPLEINVGAVLCARHQFIATHPPLGNRGADRCETARVRASAGRAVGTALQRHPVLAAVDRCAALLHAPIFINRTNPANRDNYPPPSPSAAYARADLHAQASGNRRLFGDRIPEEARVAATRRRTLAARTFTRDAGGGVTITVQDF